MISLLALAALRYIVRRAHSNEEPAFDFYLSLLIMAAAVAGGMLAGSFASPGPGAEATQFKLVAGLISTFALLCGANAVVVLLLARRARVRPEAGS